MAVSPIDLLAIAQELMGRDREIYYRSAANRAYYSAFHFCLNLAATLPKVSAGGRGSHEKLINGLKSHRVKRATRNNDLNVRMLGDVLRQAKPIRVDADYHISKEFGRTEAERMILMASKISEIISEIGRE